MSSNTACGAHKAVRLAPVNSTEKLYQTSELIMARLVLTQILCKSLTVLTEKCLVCHFSFCSRHLLPQISVCVCVYMFTPTPLLQLVFVTPVCGPPRHWDIAEEGIVLLHYNQRLQVHFILKPVRDSWFSDLFLSCRSDLLWVVFLTHAVKLGHVRNDKLLTENVLKQISQCGVTLRCFHTLIALVSAHDELVN